MNLKEANKVFDARQVCITAIEETVNERASSTFEGLQTLITSLEEKLIAYGPLLEFLQANHAYLKDLTNQLEPRFEALESKVAQTHDTLLFYIEMLPSLQTLAEAIRTHSASKPKIDSPEKFSGNREDWKSFQSRLEMYFLAHGCHYQADTVKIIIVISRLGDTAAYKYMERHIPAFKLDDEERPAIISSTWTSFGRS